MEDCDGDGLLLFLLQVTIELWIFLSVGYAGFLLVGIGQVPKWPKGADCKSVAIGFQGSNPCLPTTKSMNDRVMSAESLEKKEAGIRRVVLPSTQSSALRTEKRAGVAQR